MLDLAGYTVYWGEDPDTHSDSVTLDNPGLTSYVVENLTTGTYYFWVSAYNGDGVESELTNRATKTIQ